MTTPHRQSLDVLIVEDNALIALELQLLIEEFGHRCVGSFARSTLALEAARVSQPDVGLIDLNLADGRTGGMVVRKLKESGIPSVVISGEARHTLETQDARVVLEKPLRVEALKKVLDEIAAEVSSSGQSVE